MDKTMQALEREASTGNPKSIRALSKATTPEDQRDKRNPRCYPWAGDRWKRMHWSILVLDPCLMIDGKRFVRISEGFAAKNEKGRVEPSRDGTGRRVPAMQKDLPWQEWLWITGTGGFPKPMRGYQQNKTPAGCFYQVPAAELEVPVPPPPPGYHDPCNKPEHKFLQTILGDTADTLGPCRGCHPIVPPPPPPN